VAESNQAAVLTRVIDCPKPEPLEQTDAPKEDASNSQRKNYSGAENQGSQKNFFRSESAMKIVGDDINRSEQSEKNRRLLH
jgi:hypothetical protein